MKAKITLLKITTLTCVLLLLNSCVLLDERYRRNINEDISQSKFANTLIETNEEFLIAATELSLKQILFGQLAHESGQSTDVKKLGHKIVGLNEKILSDLNELATAKYVLLPSINSEKVLMMHTKMRSKSGSDFDNYFFNLIIKCQKEAIDLFEEGVISTNDPSIRDFAMNRLPELHEQLQSTIHVQTNCKKNKRCYPLQIK